jgi:hypothetical protein
VAPYSATRVVGPFDDGLTNVDWRDFGVINEIQDQGSCGSCWAFSTAAHYESVYAIKFGPLYKLSEQHLVDCDPYDWGCDGGLQQ